MNRLFTCRRTFVATLGIVCLTWLGLQRSMDVSMAIASIAGAVAGFNAYEKKGQPVGNA